MPRMALLDRDFTLLADLLYELAEDRPDHIALVDGTRTLTYAALNDGAQKVATTLQAKGLGKGDAIAICAASSLEYALVFMGGLRAGVAVSPLAPSSTPQSLAAMVADCAAPLLFLDNYTQDVCTDVSPSVEKIALDDSPCGLAFSTWLSGDPKSFKPVTVTEDDPFNIIYSSGTTGTPKGIVQSHGMRWLHVKRAGGFLYGPDAVAMISTPLYSNTTLVSFFPTLAFGGTVVLMKKFEAKNFLDLSQKHKATHAMLVPVQYTRLMNEPDFESYDLSSYVMKFSTSAPFSGALKKDILSRWPGGLIEYYGMTEGGGTCILAAHLFPDKVHTVGMPAEGHDIRLIDEEGHEVPRGEIGEVVGHSGMMMKGYHNQPGKTAEAEWFTPDGRRFIRTGDVGRFDEDGFLTLMDRRKDMIISGGFNIYPSDIESVMSQHESVADVAVIGVPSEVWGETPVGIAVAREGSTVIAEELCAWVNERVGKTQRLAYVKLVDELPRSAIGKILKRELRDSLNG